MKKRTTYSGVKIVKKWIAENTFRLYEYTEYPTEQSYRELVASLAPILKGRKNTIKIEIQTKFSTHVKIDYNPRYKGSFTLYINRNEKHKV